MTKKITESSSPSNGISFSPFPQNLNAPTEGVINDGVPETMKISIESFLPYIPKSKKPLEAPTPPLSTPRYTMENGHNFGRIACPSQAPTFGRKIKVPRGLPMAAEPVEFAFASEKQCKLPVMPSEAIFTAWKPIKPLRKSGVPLAKVSDISFADASVSPEVVFVGARNNELGGRGEVVDSEKLEDEAAVGALIPGIFAQNNTNKSFCVQSASSRDLARSLSIAIETPLPGDDELYSKDVPLTLSADAELDFKGCLQTSETGSPIEADENKESLLVPPQDVAIVRSPDRTVSMRVLATGPANWSEDKLDVSAGNGQAQLEEEHQNSQHQVVQELDSTTEVNPIATESASGPKTLPLGAETCPEDALLILSLAVNTPLPPDTEFDSKISALTSKSEVDNENKPQPEAPQDEVIARSLGGNASTKAVFEGAGACGLKGEFESADEDIGGLEGEATILKPHTGASTVACEDLAHYLSIAVKTPLPDDAELCSEDGSFGLPLGFNTSLSVDTESDSESSLPILESEPPLEGVGHSKPLLEPLGGVGVAGSPNNALLSKDIFTVGSPTKQPRKHRALSAMEPEISFADTSAPREVIFGVAGTGGFEGVDEVNGELGDDVMESAGTPGITSEGGTSKFHCTQVVSSDSLPEDIDSTLSIALKTPLPDDDEPCGGDASLTTPLSLDTPPIDTESDTDCYNDPLKAPQDAVISRPPGSPVSTEAVRTDEELRNPLCKSCALLANKTENLPDNPSVSWEAVSGGSGTGGRDSGEELVDVLGDKVSTFKGQIVSSSVISEDLVRYLSITVKIPLPDNPEILDENTSLGSSLTFTGALPINTRLGSERQLSTPEIEHPVEAGSDNRSLLEAPQNVSISRSPDSATSTGVLITGLVIEGIKDKLDVGVGFEQEQLEEKHQHSQSQVIQEHNSPGEVIPIITEPTPDLKDPFLHNTKPCSEDVLLALSLAANTPLPADTEFDSESHQSILEIKPQPETSDGNKFLLEAPQDVTATRLPGSTVSTEAVFTDGKPTKPLHQDCVPLAKKLETAFANVLTSPEVILGSLGANGLTGADEVTEEPEDKVVAFKAQIVSSNVSPRDPAHFLSLAIKTPLPDDELCSEDASLTHSLAVNTPLPAGTEFDSEGHPSIPEIKSPPGASDDNKLLLEAPQDVTATRPPGSIVSTEAAFTDRKPTKPLHQRCVPLAKKPETAFANVLASPEVISGSLGANGLSGAGEVTKEPEDEVVAFKAQIVSSNVSSRDLIHSLSLAIKTPLPDDELCSEDASLTHSLAVNTPLPADTGFDPEGHPSIPEIKSPPGASDGNKFLLETPQDFTATRLPGSTVSTEAVFTDGKPTKPLHQDCVPLAMKPETAFANVLTSPEVISGSLGANGLGGAGEVTKEPEDKVVAFKAQIVSSNVSSRDLAHFLSLAIKTPLPDDELCSEDASLTHSLAVNTPLPADTESGSEHPLSITETESPPGALGESNSLLDASRDVGIAGSSGRAVSAEVILTDEKPVGMLCQPHALLSEEPEIVFASTSVSPQLISGRESLAQSLAVNTPLPIDDEFDFEKPLSNLETKSPPEADDRNKSLLETPQDVVIAKAPDTTISTEELAVGVLSGCSGSKGNQEKDIGGVNEEDQLENVHPYDHSLHLKDLNSTLEATAAITKSTFGLPLPPQEKTPAAKAEEYGHCKIFKSTVITPRTGTATLCLLPSNTELSHTASSSTLSSHSSTDTGEAGFSLVGFRETKLEYDLTDLFVGIFKEVGVVDLALSPCTSAGTTRPSSEDLPAEKKEIAASPVDASDEVAATSDIGKEKRFSVQKVFAKLRKASSVRKGAVKLFNKFSPMPVDVVE